MLIKKKLFGFEIIINLILLIIGSWLLIHLFAFFGFFIALAYPLWWFFAPKQSVCLLCRAQSNGSYCKFCKRTINKSEGFTPQNLTSALGNGFIIFLFSLLSLAGVFVEAKVLHKIGFPPTQKTASFVIPSKGQYRVGEIFSMNIAVQNINNPINAIQADIGFNPDRLEVVEISTRHSFAKVFIQKEINNSGGWARLTGGIPNPGWLENQGTFGIVYFRAKSPGLAKVTFLKSSLVLANDGRGTDVLKKIPDAAYLILPEKISEEERKKQLEIYKKENILGISTMDDQLTFYEEKSMVQPNISEENIINTEKKTFLHLILSGIASFDQMPLQFWNFFLY